MSYASGRHHVLLSSPKNNLSAICSHLHNLNPDVICSIFTCLITHLQTDNQSWSSRKAQRYSIGRTKILHIILYPLFVLDENITEQNI